MKKNLAILSVIAIILLINFEGYTQNLNFESVAVKHRSLPQQPLAEGLVTYNSLFKPVDIELSRAQLESMRTKNLVLEGFTYQEENADVTIELIVDVLKFNSRDILDKSTKKKEGETEVTVPQFQYSINYDYPYTIKVIDNTTGSVLLEEGDVMPISYVYPEKSYAASQSKLANMYEDAKGRLISNIRKTGMNKVLALTKSMVNSQFGYPVTTLNFELSYVKKYKKFDYSDLYGAFEDMRYGLNQLKEDWYVQAMDGSSLQKALDVFTKAKQEYSPGAKKVRINEKVAFMINHNAAICNFFLKNFADCESSMAGIGKKAAYQMKSNQKFLKKYLQETEERFTANNIDYK